MFMSKEKNEIDFEESMEKLEKIAKELESDKLSLNDSVKKFEEGMKISQDCKKVLDEAEKKITILIDDTEKDLEVDEED
jgi:exodeoxyribonuclease VII small subunit